MGQREEAVLRAFLACQDANDLDGAMAFFADDAVYHMIAWRKPVVGPDAIRASLGDVRMAGNRILNIASVDSIVFVEVIDTVMHGDTEVTTHYAMVIEVGDDGKIMAERDYWDTKEMETQLR
jgi:limonene-1,2-epoxide hydrolase